MNLGDRGLDITPGQSSSPPAEKAAILALDIAEHNRARGIVTVEDAVAVLAGRPTYSKVPRLGKLSDDELFERILGHLADDGAEDLAEARRRLEERTRDAIAFLTRLLEAKLEMATADPTPPRAA